MTWQEINNKRLPFIRLGERLFRGVYSEVRKELIASMQNNNVPEYFIEDARKLVISEDMFRTAFERLYVKTGIAFAKWIVKGHRPAMERKQEDDWVRIITEYVCTNTGAKITKLIKTHYEDIERITRAAVEEGIKEGYGMDKIARSIQKASGEMDLWKAQRIARTEVVAASNEGVKVGAEDLPGTKEKVWISTFDERSRPDHMAMDGEREAWMDDFTLPSGVTLEFPGDPKANAPEETINCRCGYEIIVKSES